MYIRNLFVLQTPCTAVLSLAPKNTKNQVIHKACAADYLYYGTPSPWLHVKLLKFLQMFPPPADRSQREKLDEALERIITKTEVGTMLQKTGIVGSINR